MFGSIDMSRLKACQATYLACSRALFSAGSKRLIRIAMIPIDH